MKLKTVCVFCAANPGNDPSYVVNAREFGRFLALSGRRVVFGGGRTGLMGALAEGVLGAGGEAIGVMPRNLVEREVAHTGLTTLHIVDSMHERKALLSEMSDGFIAMPGGLGTMEELFEVWTWGQLGLHRKPYGLLEMNGFYAPLLTFLSHAVTQGFIGAPNLAMLAVDTDATALLERMETMELTGVRKWVERGET